jgi:ArsR family transcriptional regulator
MSKSDLLLSPPQAAACCDPGAQLVFPSGQGDPVTCCAPLSQGALSAEQAEQVAPLLKALADPVRLRLMSLVASHPGGEACVCDLSDAFDLSQPTISHHLKVLHESGLLDREKRGVWVYYRARAQALASLGALIGYPADPLA